MKYIILSTIAKAQTSLYLASYGFSDPDLIALIKEKAHGNIPIKITYDKDYPPPLSKNIVELNKDTKSGLMHRKITIVDNQIILLGSTNSTEPSMKIHNNLLLYMENKSLADAIENSFFYQTENFTYFPLPSEKKLALDSLLELIDSAQDHIHLAIFTFTHKTLVDKLIEAHNRGVKVRVTIDSGSARSTSKSAVTKLRQHGIPIYQQLESCLFHHKCALIDEKFVMGSVNWTKSGFERNREYLMIFTKMPQNDLLQVKKFFNLIEHSSKRLQVSKKPATKKSWRIPYFPSHFLCSSLWIPLGTSPSTYLYCALLRTNDLCGSYSEKCA